MSNTQLILAGLLGAAMTARAADTTIHSFKKLQLSDQFWSEGADFGDFNHDGKKDVASGPFWYEGPDFKTRHEYRAATKTSEIKKADGTKVTIPGWKGALSQENDYSDNFFTFVYDINGDGWDDIVVIGLPSTDLRYYENPKGQKAADGSEHWIEHKVYKPLDNESPMWVDLNGDGKPEVVCNSEGYLGYVQPNWAAPTQPWKFHRITPHGSWHMYTHGIGYGDINGDGRNDLLEQNGWWEQPKSLEGDPQWTFHAWPFAPGEGAAQMFGYDVNGDGLTDVVTCLNPHGYGLAWYEQYRENGDIKFRQHIIMGKTPKDSKFGVKFSQPHAIELVDMDGDGLKDIVTGKRFWAHGPSGDVEPNAAAVVYWFKLVRGPNNSADFIPFLADDNSGVGTQVAVGDVNGDKLPDIVIGNKKGTFVLLHEAKQASPEEWQKAQPKPVSAP